MNRESLTNLIELINENMYSKSVINLFNSIGSNLFIEIGKEIELPLGKGKREEWVVWISNSTWRITQDGRYIVGSGDYRDNIKIGIEQLLDRKIQKIFFTSDFLDLQIEFDHGYRVNTFFSWITEDQWTIFMPNAEDITSDLSNVEEIKAVQNIAKEFTTTQEYISLDQNLEEFIIEDVYLNEINQLQIVLKNNYTIDIASARWRIESNGEFLLGYFHDEIPDPERIFKQFIGKQIRQISVSESLMDAVFQVGTDLILRTFAFTRSVVQWELYKTMFRANIGVCDLF